MRRVAVVLVIVLAAAGCIEKDTSHTLYLEPGGSLTWIVLDRHVRSDAREEATRLSEESEYLEAILLGRDPVAEALAALGATSVETRLLRDQRPYWGLTEARFRWVDEMVERLLAESGIPGSVRMWSDRGRTTLEVVIPFEEPPESDEEGFSLDALVADFEAYTIILTEGELVQATGFEIDGDTARLVEPDVDELEAAGQLVLSLTWIAAGE